MFLLVVMVLCIGIMKALSKNNKLSLNDFLVALI